MFVKALIAAFACVIGVCVAVPHTLAQVEAAAKAQNVTGPNGLIPELGLKTYMEVAYISDAALFESVCPDVWTVSFPNDQWWEIDGVDPTLLSTPFAVKNFPHLRFTPPLNATSLYTITLHDMDGHFSHMLAFNIYGQAFSGPGQIIHTYFSPANFAATPNRYVWLVFEQTNGYVTLDPVDQKNWEQYFVGRTMVNVTQMVEKYDLGPPVAANWQRSKVDGWVPNLWADILSAPYVPAGLKKQFAGVVNASCANLSQ